MHELRGEGRGAFHVLLLDRNGKQRAITLRIETRNQKPEKRTVASGLWLNRYTFWISRLSEYRERDPGANSAHIALIDLAPAAELCRVKRGGLFGAQDGVAGAVVDDQWVFYVRVDSPT